MSLYVSLCGIFVGVFFDHMAQNGIDAYVTCSLFVVGPMVVILWIRERKVELSRGASIAVGFIFLAATFAVVKIAIDEGFFSMLVPIPVLFMLASMSDFTSIYLARKVARDVQVTTSFGGVLALFLFDLSVFLILLIGPIYLARTLKGSPNLLNFGYYSWLLAYANVTTVCATLIVTSAGALLLAHRVLWPLIVRVLYQPIRHRIVQRKKSMFAMGLVFLSWGGAPPFKTGIEFLGKILSAF